MSQDPENFDALRKLLAVKRHEQPPPGYFDQMASEVMARLKTGEDRQVDLWKELGDEASWVQRVLSLFNARPALAGICGVALCGIIMGGIYLAQPPRPADTVVSTPLIQKMDAPVALTQAEPTKTVDSSTNPVVNSLNGSSPFDKLGISGQPVPVSFPAGGN